MPEHETRAPARSASASTSTSTSTSTAGASTTNAAGNAAAVADAGLGANQSEGGVDGLRSATDTGDAGEAWAIFTTLAPQDYATLKTDTALVPRFLNLVGAERSATALWTLQYPIRLYLELANVHCAASVAALGLVLRDVGIHGASDLGVHAADLGGLRAFGATVVLDPVLAVSSAVEDASLLGSSGGHDLLLPVYHGSPLTFLHFLPMDSAVTLDLFLTNEAARAWLLEDAASLVDHILHVWNDTGTWYRSLARNLPSELNGLVSANPSAWATAFIDLLRAGNPEDALLLTPPSDLFRLVIGCIAAQDKIAAADTCHILNLNRLECLRLFAAEGWLDRESAARLIAGADLAAETAIASDAAIVTALTSVAWVADLLPLLGAQPIVMGALYSSKPEFRAWMAVDPVRFEAAAKTVPNVWVAMFVAARDVTWLLRFAVNDPATWRAATTDAYFLLVLGVLPKPCAEADVPGIWALWKDANRSVEAGLEAFHTIYGLRIWTSGAHPERPLPDWTNTAGITWERKQEIMTVDPSQQALNDYLAHLQTIPRGQVAASAVGFGNGWNIHFKRKTPPAHTAWDLAAGSPQFNDGRTSQYWNDMNFILMYTNADGTITGGAGTAGWISGPQRISNDGNPSGAGGGRQTTDATGALVNQPPTTDTGLTYFQNHARHEVGHGVGARPFPGMTTSGDEAARKFANWKDSSPTEMKAAYFTGAPNTVADVPDTTGTNRSISKGEIGHYLMHIVSNNGAEPATSTTPGTGGMMTGLFAGTRADRLNGLLSSSASTVPLLNYVDVVLNNGGGRDFSKKAYEYPNFTPPGATAYIYSGAQGGFRKYDKQVMTDLVPVIGWYALSTHSELFAEIYTQHYSTGSHWAPAARKGVNFATFFTQLEASTGSQLQTGVPPAIPGVGGAPAPAAPTPAPAAPAAPGAAPTPGAAAPTAGSEGASEIGSPGSVAGASGASL